VNKFFHLESVSQVWSPPLMESNCWLKFQPSCGIDDLTFHKTMSRCSQFVLKCDLIWFTNCASLSHFLIFFGSMSILCTSSLSSSLIWFVNLLLFHHRPSFQSLFNLYFGSQNYTHTFIWHRYQYLSHSSRKLTGFHWSVTETIRLQTKNS